MGVEDRWMCMAARIAEPSQAKAAVKREVAAETIAPCSGAVASRFQVRALSKEIGLASAPPRLFGVCNKPAIKASNVCVIRPDLFA